MFGGLKFSALHDLCLGEKRGSRLVLIMRPMIQLVMPIGKTQSKLKASESLLVAAHIDVQGAWETLTPVAESTCSGVG